MSTCSVQRELDSPLVDWYLSHQLGGKSKQTHIICWLFLAVRTFSGTQTLSKLQKLACISNAATWFLLWFLGCSSCLSKRFQDSTFRWLTNYHNGDHSKMSLTEQTHIQLVYSIHSARNHPQAVCSVNSRREEAKLDVTLLANCFSMVS